MTNLLRLGVGATFALSHRPFNMGGLGTHTSWRPFDILSPVVKVISSRPFDMMGTVAVTSERPFDLGTSGMLLISPRPFDIIDATDGQAIVSEVLIPPSLGQQVNEVQRVVIQATGGTYTLTFDTEETGNIAYDANAATVQAALEALPNVDSGDVVVSTSSSGTLLIEFTGQYAGQTVSGLSVDTTALTGPSVAGVVSQTTPAVPYGGFTTQAGIQIYDKQGRRLGSITQFTITQPPSRAVNFRGAAGFTVPRSLPDPVTGALYPNPDLELIPDGVDLKGDRLVVIGDSSRPDRPWGGVITHAEWTEGAVMVTCADVFDLLATPELPRDDTLLATQAITVPPQTLARLLVPLVMQHANDWFARNGEVLWGVDATGSETFFGYQTLTGSVESALNTISLRAFGERAFRIDLSATSMTPVLEWRDKFMAGTGPDLTDGDMGNVVAGVSMSADPTQVVNGIRLVGSVTKIESKLPAGAVALPYREIVPVAEVWWDTQGYRRRVNNESAGFLWEVEVPFTIEEDGIAAEEEARRRQQFRDFIHGFHAQFGRPWHDGWAWNAGSGSDDEHELYELGLDDERYLTQDNWVHYRQMAVFGWNNENRPAAIVMRRRGWQGQTASYKQYTVKKGDTLWSISKALYGSGQQWDELYEINRGRIRAALIDRGINPYGDRKYDLFKGTVLDYQVAGGTTFTGRTVSVFYDRVNAVQVVFPRRRVRPVAMSTVFDFEWRAYNMGRYDPGSNGIGVDSPYRTVKGGALRTRSWRVVPANQGGSGSTSLLYGITPTVTKIPVVSVFPLPTQFPFVITVGADEKMLVHSIQLNVLTVTRGYLNTPASIHEAGEPVEYKVEEDEEEQVEETTPPPEQIAWPEGEAYAARLLQEVHLPKRRWSLRLANVGGDWSSIEIGSQHSVNVQSEGPGQGMTGTVRVLGYTPDPQRGVMELVVEDVL